MKSFEEHLRGAKAHNREDKIWLVTCFSGKMAKLCAKYGFPDDEDMSIRKRVGLRSTPVCGKICVWIYFW